jgi:xylulokinase
MLLLGIDLGTSSIKVSVINSETQKCVASAHYPDAETGIIAHQQGWAEQEPEEWWNNIQQAILRCHASKKYDPSSIAAIGIAYQMHGLVLVDAKQHVLRPSIIWCDSRAVEIGNRAFTFMGEERCLSQLLNSPGNFTASKLAWVQEHEPEIYERIDKIMLPGDFIAMKLTGEITTTPSALSEGIFWDFKNNRLSSAVLEYFGFSATMFPKIQPVFSSHGLLLADVAKLLQLPADIPVTYKAGDQLNNALALNVMQPGEVAATAGTSGVIYGVSNELRYDRASRINSFAHVNYQIPSDISDEGCDECFTGVLLCINGVGIFNRWVKDLMGGGRSYAELNELAASVPVGSEGLIALPFGNGAERMLNNSITSAHFHNLDFNKHTLGHMVRAAQEGIAYAFRYGLDIMRENGINPSVVRASKANLFLSDVFTQAFSTINQVAVEFYEGDGSLGSAIGAGIGVGFYKDAAEAAERRKPISTIHPANTKQYERLYQAWKETLLAQLKKSAVQDKMQTQEVS